MDLFYSHHYHLNLAVEHALETFEKTGLLVITGASGSGKSFLARRLHEWSTRREAPFFAQDAAALAENRFESQLFGHLKGAFSDASRDFPGLLGAVGEGTLCLEGLEELTPANQAKMLRFLQTRDYRPVGGLAEKSFRGALILTARQPLTILEGKDLLRHDFFFRISAGELSLPPMSERPQDFAMLAEHLAASIRAELNMDVAAPAAGWLSALSLKKIVGNLHGLRNLIQQAMIRGVSLGELPMTEPPARLRELPDTGSLKGDSKVLEALLLKRGLRLHPHSRKDLARHLGISPRSLMYKLKEHELG